MPTARSGVAGGVYNGKIYVAGGKFQNDKIMAAFRAVSATNSWDGGLPACVSRGTVSPAPSSAISSAAAGGIQTAGIPGAVIYTDTHDVFDFTKN
jgi:hypothetical protein